MSAAVVVCVTDDVDGYCHFICNGIECVGGGAYSEGTDQLLFVKSGSMFYIW